MIITIRLNGLSFSSHIFWNNFYCFFNGPFKHDIIQHSTGSCASVQHWHHTECRYHHCTNINQNDVILFWLRQIMSNCYGSFLLSIVSESNRAVKQKEAYKLVSRRYIACTMKLEKRFCACRRKRGFFNWFFCLWSSRFWIVPFFNISFWLSHSLLALI